MPRIQRTEIRLPRSRAFSSREFVPDNLVPKGFFKKKKQNSEILLTTEAISF